MSSVLRWVWDLRIRGYSGQGIGPWAGLSMLLVLLAPSQWIDRTSFWTLSTQNAGQALLTTLAFLALVLILATAATRTGNPRLITGLIAAAVCYGAA